MTSPGAATLSEGGIIPSESGVMSAEGDSY